jgi:ferredoxin--NADP+ reductase
MIDGTGMCGGCRVLVDGKSEFACVDGPEFDAHRVDFAVLVQRNSMYRAAEQTSMEQFQHATESQPEPVLTGQTGACAVKGDGR